MQDNGNKYNASQIIRRRIKMKQSYILPAEKKRIASQILIAKWWKRYINYRKIILLFY